MFANTSFTVLTLYTSATYNFVWYGVPRAQYTLLYQTNLANTYMCVCVCKVISQQYNKPVEISRDKCF